MTRTLLFVGLLGSGAACGISSNGNSTTSTDSTSSNGGALNGAGDQGTGGQGPTQTGEGPSEAVSTPGGSVGNETSRGTTSSTVPGSANLKGASAAGSTATTDGATPDDASRTGGMTAETSGAGGTSVGGTLNGEVMDDAAGGSTGNVATANSDPEVAVGGQTGVGDKEDSQTGGAGGADGGLPMTCVGNAIPSADPTRAGPFEATADKNVGPLAGVVPDPIYGDHQQRFNVYRPSNLTESEYCHPILIWANGYTDNPEPNPPECVVDSAANKWCGQYLPLMNHLASHGFVVVASLSTATAEGEPLPTIAGLDWILEQAEDSSSPYYHRLDTANIGQLGHSYGAMSTCMSASEPRYKALAAICGTRPLTGVHTPMLFFCGGNDTTVDCSGVKDTFLTVTEQPAFFIDELNSDHGSWVYQGASGVSLSMSAAWFRAHLMNDAESRKYFYGANCRFCTDNRVQVEQNSLMAQ